MSKSETPIRAVAPSPPTPLQYFYHINNGRHHGSSGFIRGMEGHAEARRRHHEAGQRRLEGPYTFASRFESGPGTNPEELIGAAHAGCFSMFLSALLTEEGFPHHQHHRHRPPGCGPTITLIELDTEAVVPGFDEEAFQQLAEDAKKGCPVSKALAGPEIKLKAKLIQ